MASSVWYLQIKQLLHDLQHGFVILSDIRINPLPDTYTNRTSAVDNCQAVTAKIQNELYHHRISGPFNHKPPGLIVSPLAGVSKKDSTEIHLIHDLSFPLGNSVNYFIPRDLCSVEYELIDDCIDIILSLGKGCLMAKTDMSSAFRILPVSMSSYKLLGFQWSGQYYFDRCLPMGCSVSCNTFEKFSTAIQWILINKLNVTHMSHILDDFMFFGGRLIFQLKSCSL